MPTTRIQEKLSTIVASQLPEHIRSDYPTFVKFIEAYYEFLEQDQHAQELLQNSLSYRDVDKTIESFITNFLKQYLPFIPKTALADKKILVKKIRDLYSSKGSSKSYELLFRILYNIVPEISFPFEQVLRSSDGKWIQKSTVFIDITFGDPNDLVGKEADLVNDNKRTKIKLGEKTSVQTKAGSNYFTSPSIFEYEFDNITNVNLQEGDTVITSTARGTVVAVPTRVEILSPGKGFQIGEIITVEIGDGIGLKLKVIKVDSEGGILNVQILRYGINYPATFYYAASSDPVSAPPPPVSIIGVPGSFSITLNDYTIFLDDGFVNTPNYFLNNLNSNDNYCDSTYAGPIVSTFTYNEPLETEEDLLRQAQFNITKGVKAFYPGYYKSTDGFLSDEFKLEDRDFYQPYSYVIRSVKQFNEYRNAILDLIHPVGTKLHGDYLLSDTFDLTVSILSKFGFSVNDFIDFIETEESSFVKNITKNINTLNGLSENFSINFSAFHEHSTAPTSEFSFLFNQNITLNQPATDSYEPTYEKTVISNDYAHDYFITYPFDYSLGYTNTVPNDHIGTTEDFSVVLNP